MIVLACFCRTMCAGETLPGSTKRTTLNDLWVFNPRTAWYLSALSSSRRLKPMFHRNSTASHAEDQIEQIYTSESQLKKYEKTYLDNRKKSQSLDDGVLVRVGLVSTAIL